jgi:spore coat protein H
MTIEKGVVTALGAWLAIAACSACSETDQGDPASASDGGAADAATSGSAGRNVADSGGSGSVSGTGGRGGRSAAGTSGKAGGSTGSGGQGGEPAGDLDAGDAATGNPDAGMMPPIPEPPGSNVFDRDVLHVVSITVAAADLPQLDEHTDVRVPATLVFDGETLTQVGVRNKGQTSFQPVSQKPSFSVKINEFVPGQKLDGLKKLLLNNTVQDPTWCNETLTYETYRRAGLPAPRVAFAVVTLNGVPKGIYSIGEAVNQQFLAREFGADMDQGNLYEGPWDFSQSIDQADLKDEVEENRSKADLQALTDIVLSAADDGFADRLAARLDVDQFIRGYAVDAVTVAWDGYAYDAWNYYMYDHPKDNRFVFIPTGANWPYVRDSADKAPTVDPRVLKSLWGGGDKDPASFLAGARVQKIPSLDARFDAAVRDVTHGAFDVAALHADFDRIRKVLHSQPTPDEATERDLKTFDEKVDMAYDFVEQRKTYLLQQFP